MNQISLPRAMLAGAVAGAVVLAGGAYWLGAARESDAQSGMVLTAREFRVVDRQGVQRGSFGMQPDGSISFTGAARTGETRTQVGVGSNGEPFIELQNPGQGSRIVLRVLPNGDPAVYMTGPNGQTSTPMIVTPPRPSGTAGDCTVSPRPPDAAEQAVLDAINAVRREAGLAPLVLSPVLSRAALWKTAQLGAITNRPIVDSDHDDGFRTWEQRIIDCGYSASQPFAEILGSAQGSDASPLSLWLTSAVHRPILLDPTWQAVGIARVVAGSQGGMPLSHWVLTFGVAP